MTQGDPGHNDPSNWIWGIFYYNKNDKRLFPPKRFPAMGWTINFARPGSILFLLALFAIAVLISLLSRAK